MKRGSSKFGYTILEVLVAVIILAIVLPGLATYVIYTRKSQVSSSRLEQGTAVAQKVIDSLALYPSSVLGTSGYLTQTLDGTSYTINWMRKPRETGGNLITMTINWTVGKQARTSVLTGAIR